MDLGRDLGNYLGVEFPVTITEARLSEASNIDAQVEWLNDDPSFYQEPLYHVFVDRQRLQITDELISQVPVFQRRSFVEIIGSGPLNDDEDLKDPVDRLEAPAGNRVAVTWEFPEDQEEELARFEILYDNGGGTPNIILGTADPEDRLFVTDFIPNGTYKFRVNPIDIEENILQATTTDMSVLIDSTPIPVEGLEFTYSESTEKATFTWDVVADAGADVRVYTNGGSGPIDWTSSIATVTYPTATFETSVLTEGDHKFGFRTELSGVLDPSVDRFKAFSLRGLSPPVLALFPNLPDEESALPVFGSKVSVSCSYSSFNEGDKALSAKVYSNAPGGANPVDFSTPILTIPIPQGSTPEDEIFQVALEGTTGTLTSGVDHKFVIRIQGETRETENTTPELLATPVAEPQPQPTGVTLEVI